MARGWVVVAGSFVGVLVVAAALALLDYNNIESGCAVQTCEINVIMKPSATRVDGVAVRQQYLAFSGVKATDVGLHHVLVRVQAHGQLRPRLAYRYTFWVSRAGKDPVDLDVRSPLIDYVIEPA